MKMAPDSKVIAGVVPNDASARALSQPGKAYAIYCHGGKTKNLKLTLDLPPGRYRAGWLNTRTGQGRQIARARKPRAKARDRRA